MISGEQEEYSVKAVLSDHLSTIYLGEVMDVWQEQQKICVGSHADFAKHLLAVHKEYCLDYCRAESQEKAARLSACVENPNVDEENSDKHFR